MKWTKKSIPDLKGKIIVVTGGNSGLGFEAVKMFAEKNATVVLATRNLKNGNAAKERILQDVAKANIDVLQLDLADFNSIENFTTEFKSKYDKLDVLLNNAGVMWCPYSETKDGLESQMGVNHFGHFKLTALLIDSLKLVKGARVVTVSSIGHRRGKIDFENLMYNETSYNPNQAYYNSKLANLLFTYELQRKFEEHGLDIISVAAHPGGSNTNLMRHVKKKWSFILLKPIFLLVAQSAAKGTLPEVRASVDSKVKGGEYYGPKGMLGEAGGYPQLVESIPASHSKEDAKRLWDMSEEITGTKYIFQ